MLTLFEVQKSNRIGNAQIPTLQFTSTSPHRTIQDVERLVKPKPGYALTTRHQSMVAP